MSIKKTKIVIIFMLLMTLSGAVLYSHFSTPQQEKEKWSRLTHSSKRNPATWVKPHGVLQVQIQAKVSTTRWDEEFTLIGTVKVKKEMPFLQMKWTLPSQIKLLSGQLTQTLTSVQEGENLTFEIVAQKQSPSDANIIFEAFTDLSGYKMGAVEVFDSKQLSQEFDHLEMKKAQGIFLKQQGFGPKIYQ